MDAKMIFNLDDANCDLPTTGKAWEILLEHVKENAMHRDLYLGDLQDEDIIEELQRRGLSVADVFDDDEIRDHVHDCQMPIDEIFDEDEILDCGCVMDAIDGRDKKIAKLQKKIAKLEKEVQDGDVAVKLLIDANRKVVVLELANADLVRCNGIQDGDIRDCRNIIAELEKKKVKYQNRLAERCPIEAYTSTEEESSEEEDSESGEE
jgi:hypothetical protein